MSDSESDEITFTGSAPGKFIAAVRRHAHSEGKHQDNEWQADFAVGCFQGSGKVMRWYATLEEDVQTDWDKLSKALIERFGGADVKESGARAEPDSDLGKQDDKDGADSERQDEDQYTPETEKTESELFDTTAPQSPASTYTNYITPLPTPPISRTGRIRLADDAEPTAKPSWISKRRNGNGAHTACENAMDAMVVSYKSRCGSKERLGVQSRADPECEDAWLGVTWPGRHSDDWTKNPTLVAAFATVTHDKTGTKWVSSSNRDEGATEHEIWRVSEDDTMEIEYLEDNGKTHSLGTVKHKNGKLLRVPPKKLPFSSEPGEINSATWVMDESHPELWCKIEYKKVRFPGSPEVLSGELDFFSTDLRGKFFRFGASQ